MAQSDITGICRVTSGVYNDVVAKGAVRLHKPLPRIAFQNFGEVHAAQNDVQVVPLVVVRQAVCLLPVWSHTQKGVRQPNYKGFCSHHWIDSVCRRNGFCAHQLF